MTTIHIKDGVIYDKDGNVFEDQEAATLLLPDSAFNEYASNIIDGIYEIQLGEVETAWQFRLKGNEVWSPLFANIPANIKDQFEYRQIARLKGEPEKKEDKFSLSKAIKSHEHLANIMKDEPKSEDKRPLTPILLKELGFTVVSDGWFKKGKIMLHKSPDIPNFYLVEEPFEWRVRTVSEVERVLNLKFNERIDERGNTVTDLTRSSEIINGVEVEVLNRAANTESQSKEATSDKWKEFFCSSWVNKKDGTITTITMKALAENLEGAVTKWPSFKENCQHSRTYDGWCLACGKNCNL